ncbi:MAG: hypothetical protein CM15mV87_390 [Caudoviricetes sp.]|nr:MAG: hypothetical protein CM15mV87_390 [Caudoviricetes sp.]
MSGAFPISSAGFQVATIKTVKKTLLSKPQRVKDLQDK